MAVHYDQFGKHSDPPRTIEVKDPHFSRFKTEIYRLQDEFNKRWAERYTWVAGSPQAVMYWQSRETDLLNRLAAARRTIKGRTSLKDVQAKMKEIWPFGRGMERPARGLADLDAYYMAVGLRVEWFTRMRVLVTPEMESRIMELWRPVCPPAYASTDFNTLMAFHPHHNGRPMSNGALELLWPFVEQDLREQGVTTEDPGQETARQPEGPSTKAKKPGRRSVHDEQQRLDILEAWEKAKKAGISKKKFCRDTDIEAGKLERYQNWKRMRDRRDQGGHSQ